MKQGKPLKREFKEILSANGLNWREYQAVAEWETKIIVRHKVTGMVKAVDKRKG